MNATQSKQLLKAARRAVSFLEPDTRAWQDLKIALMAVSNGPARATSKAKNLRAVWQEFGKDAKWCAAQAQILN